MTSDQITVTTPPATETLPLDLDRIRRLAYYDEGYVDDETLKDRTLACIELFEQETGQVLLASTLKAVWPPERFGCYDSPRTLLPLKLPGLDCSLLTLTEDGDDILPGVSVVPQRSMGYLEVYPDTYWIGRRIEATFTAGIPPDGQLPSLVVEILGDALRWRYLHDEGARGIFYNLIERWTL